MGMWVGVCVWVWVWVCGCGCVENTLERTGRNISTFSLFWKLFVGISYAIGDITSSIAFKVSNVVIQSFVSFTTRNPNVNYSTILQILCMRKPRTFLVCLKGFFQSFYRCSTIFVVLLCFCGLLFFSKNSCELLFSNSSSRVNQKGPLRWVSEWEAW